MAPLSLLLAIGTLLLAPARAAPVEPAMSERIVGGSAVSSGTYPFAVRLSIRDGSENLLCGGAFLTDSLVVTAGHCVVAEAGGRVFDAKAITVCYGASELRKQSCTTATGVTLHPDYDPVALYNDIALIDVSAVDGASTVQVYTGDLSMGDSLVTMGWGKTSDDAKTLPTELRSVNIKVGDPRTCSVGDPKYKADDGMRVCAVNADTPGKDSCQGDSGSPAVVTDNNGQVYLAGLTSAGMDLSNDNPDNPTCATKDGLAFYTRVGYFLDFIAKSSGLSESTFTNGKSTEDKDSAAGSVTYFALAPLLLAALAAL
ncbi:hypothetical protein GGF46_002511 [Coemansia sp. RSA 552]|nr:hypothetical protein GGF46_002511 [Coemansia sp. RSA 552]